MKAVALILFFISATSFSKESWLCTSESSQIENDRVLACGIGEALTEGAARKQAFNSAKAEFNHVCDVNTFCGAHKYAVEPKRTTCEHLEVGWKCYRLVVYTPQGGRRTEVIGFNFSKGKALDQMTNQEIIDLALKRTIGGGL